VSRRPLPGKNFVCIAQGFPSVPFFVNEDLTRADGVVRCRAITEEEVLTLSWKLLRVFKYLRRVPIVF
jgi:hypothetical protein